MSTLLHMSIFNNAPSNHHYILQQDPFLCFPKSHVRQMLDKQLNFELDDTPYE